MMYSLFDVGIVYDRRRHVTIEVLDGYDYGDADAHTWACTPIPTPLPLGIYLYKRRWPLLDAFAGVGHIYSLRLVRLLEQAGVMFQAFPARLIDERTRDVISDEYATFHLLEKHQLSRRGADFFANRRASTSPPSLLCRDTYYPNLIFIHDDLRRTLEEAGITGCEYTPSPYSLLYT